MGCSCSTMTTCTASTNINVNCSAGCSVTNNIVQSIKKSIYVIKNCHR